MIRSTGNSVHSYANETVEPGQLCLRDAQKASLTNMLNLNKKQCFNDMLLNPNDAELSNLPIWKVLFYDARGVSIISPILRKYDLRENGITVQANISADRAPIPDVPAIYFIEPSDSNINHVIEDLQRDMYDQAYVNFTSWIPRDLLEIFAQKAKEANVSHKVASVYDQYLNFITLGPDMFSLGQPDVYKTLHDPRYEDQIEQTIDKIVSGLFSVVITLSSIPIIRCPPGGAAELIAKRLNAKIADFPIKSLPTMNKSDYSQRPILVIIDRNFDLTPMFSHSWTYEALVHDLLNFQRGQITLKDTATDSKVTKKVLDIDTKDYFWAKNSRHLFPQVAENIDQELSRYKDDANEIMRKGGVDNLEDLNSNFSETVDTGHLHFAMSMMPELSRRKATIDLHFNVLTHLLPIIKSRQIDSLFQIEETISRQSKTQILELLKDPEKIAEDKLRVFLIWFFSVDEISKSDMIQFESALQNAGADLRALEYSKRIRDLTRMTMLSSTNLSQEASAPSISGGDLLKSFSSLSGKFKEKIKDAGLGNQFESLVSGIKNLIPVDRQLSISKILSSLTDGTTFGSTSEMTSAYLYFDPLRSKANLPNPTPKQTFTKAIVFTIGGGNFYEYGNLLDCIEKNKNAAYGIKRVIYGSTEILSPSQFLEEISSMVPSEL